MKFISRAKLTPRALNTAITPVISLLILSGVPRFMDPLLHHTWSFLVPTEMPIYLLDIASVLGTLSVLAGLVKFMANEQLSETLRIRGEVKTLGTEDLPIILVYTVAALIILWQGGVEINWVVGGQSVIILVLSLSFVSIPWYLWKYTALPKETDSLMVKTSVTLTAFALAAVATVLAVVGIRWVEVALS